MQELLGMRLEDALALMRERGLEASVISTCAPRNQQEGGTLRVIRVRGCELTVSAFQDGSPIA